MILKKDADNGNPLSGTQFKVTTSKGAVVGTNNGIFTTDSNGSITISNLEKGSYIVEEVKTIFGTKGYRQVIKLPYKVKK